MSFSWEVTDSCVAIPAYEVLDFSTGEYNSFFWYEHKSAGGISVQVSRQINNRNYYIASHTIGHFCEVRGYIYDFDDNLIDKGFRYCIPFNRSTYGIYLYRARGVVFPEIYDPYIIIPLLGLWSVYSSSYPFGVFVRPNIPSSDPNVAIHLYQYSPALEEVENEGHYFLYDRYIFGYPLPLSHYIASIGLYFYETKISSLGDITIDTKKGFYRPLVMLMPYYEVQHYRKGQLGKERKLFQDPEYVVFEDVSSFNVPLYPIMSVYYPVHDSLPNEQRVVSIDGLIHYPDSFWMEGTDELI